MDMEDSRSQGNTLNQEQEETLLYKPGFLSAGELRKLLLQTVGQEISKQNRDKKVEEEEEEEQSTDSLNIVKETGHVKQRNQVQREINLRNKSKNLYRQPKEPEFFYGGGGATASVPWDDRSGFWEHLNQHNYKIDTAFYLVQGALLACLIFSKRFSNLNLLCLSVWMQSCFISCLFQKSNCKAYLLRWQGPIRRFPTEPELLLLIIMLGSLMFIFCKILFLDLA